MLTRILFGPKPMTECSSDNSERQMINRTSGHLWNKASSLSLRERQQKAKTRTWGGVLGALHHRLYRRAVSLGHCSAMMKGGLNLKILACLPSGKKTSSSLRFETELNIFGWVVLNSSSVTQGLLPAHLNRGFLSRRFCEEPASPVAQHKVHFFKGAHTETSKYFKDNYVKNASFLSFFPRGVGCNNRIRKPNSWRLLAVPPDL